MGFSIVKWFKGMKRRNYSDVEEFMKQINADVSDNVRSILSSLSPEDERKLKELYYQIFKYKNDNENSLINNKFVLDAISVNGGNYEIIKEIFEYVINWDKEVYLPKGIRRILNNQISNEAIEELEALYKKYNLVLKDRKKDKSNYYFIDSLLFKEELTKCFGNAVDTFSLILKSDEIDVGRKVGKEIISYLSEMLNKREIDGRILNKIVFYIIKDVDTDQVLDDDQINDIFSNGLINSGNVLEEGITTYFVNNEYEALTILKGWDYRYSGVIVMEIPSIYFDDSKGIISEYYDKVYINKDYLRINPDFIKGYIAINSDNILLYTKKEIISKELDMPDLKDDNQ